MRHDGCYYQPFQRKHIGTKVEISNAIQTSIAK